QGPVAVAGDRGEVDEHVVTVGPGDEAVALLVAEPFHRSRAQTRTSLPAGRAGPSSKSREPSTGCGARQWFAPPRRPPRQLTTIAAAFTASSFVAASSKALILTSHESENPTGAVAAAVLLS